MGRGLNNLELSIVYRPDFLKNLSENLRLDTSLDSIFPSGFPVAYMDAAASEQAADADQQQRFVPVPAASYGTLQFVVILVPKAPSK